MPNRTAASIDTALNTILAPKISNQINRSVVLAQVLNTKRARSKNVAWDVQVGTAAPGTAAIAEDADVSVYNADTKIPAVLQFGHLHDAVTISQYAMDVAALAGPEQLAELFLEEMKDSVNRLAKHVNLGLITGTGAANHIHGMLSTGGVVPVAPTGTYAGLAPGTYSDWAGTLVTVDGGAGARRDLTFADVRNLRRQIIDKCGKRPNLYVCNPLQFDKFGALFDTNRRFEQTTEIVVGGRKIQLDGGYTALMFEGAPVIWDSDVPNDVFVALNTDEVDIEVVPPTMDPNGNRAATVSLAGTPNETTTGQTGIIARVKKLAEAGEYTRFGLFTHLQLAFRKRKAHGYINNLTQS